MSELATLTEQAKKNGIKALFDRPDRVTNCSYQIEGSLYFDYSKTHLNDDIISYYLKRASQLSLTSLREELFNGTEINLTEKRPVLHTALRDQGLNKVEYVDQQRSAEVQQSQSDFFTQVDAVKQKIDSGVLTVSSIIHVGIGGSFLGPKLLHQVLVDLDSDIDVHFISNIDAHELSDVVRQCDPQQTLVVAVSKSFTTLETLTNLDTLRAWLNDGDGDIQQVFAVTSEAEIAVDYGIPADNVASFPKGVGGRYSLWSAVSFSIALSIGLEKFKALLSGAELMDYYFLNTDLAENVCFLAACMDHFYANGFDAQTRASFAYDFRLRSLIDYLQQLETESNGKDRDKSGDLVECKTSPIVWGGVGTDVQHSVFQLLHQGTHLIPAEFILVKKPDHKYQNHHQQLLANGVAQSAALLSGQDLQQVIDNEGHDLPDVTKKAKQFSGERPSSTILVDDLDAKTLGMLIAFYEHRTFVYGVLCEINSYDQMGVELGKRLAKEVAPVLSGQMEIVNMDDSTKALLAKLAK